jgi:hypothetical protein
MANSKNARNNKEHFDLIKDIMNDKVKLAIVIAIILLSILAVYLFVTQKHQTGSSFIASLSDTSPMAPLTQTPSL